MDAGLVKRKKRSVEDARSGSAKQADQNNGASINTLSAGLVRKKVKLAGATDANASTAFAMDKNTEAGGRAREILLILQPLVTKSYRKSLAPRYTQFDEAAARKQLEDSMERQGFEETMLKLLRYIAERVLKPAH